MDSRVLLSGREWLSVGQKQRQIEWPNGLWQRLISILILWIIEATTMLVRKMKIKATFVVVVAAALSSLLCGSARWLLLLLPLLLLLLLLQQLTVRSPPLHRTSRAGSGANKHSHRLTRQPVDSIAGLLAGCSFAQSLATAAPASSLTDRLAARFVCSYCNGNILCYCC